MVGHFKEEIYVLIYVVVYVVAYSTKIRVGDQNGVLRALEAIRTGKVKTGAGSEIGGRQN